MFLFLFFFSSRRRHTRSKRDWSSDVCSSDLVGTFNQSVGLVEWDPVAGASTMRSDSGGGGLVSTSADHSKLLVAGGGTATLYDSATDQFTPVPGVQFEFATLNPTGLQFVVAGGTPLLRFFNLQMQQVGAVDVPDCCAPNTLPVSGVY